VKLAEAFAIPISTVRRKWHCKYARQNGIHVSPTFMVDGLVQADMSSGDPVADWVSRLLRPAAVAIEFKFFTMRSYRRHNRFRCCLFRFRGSRRPGYSARSPRRRTLPCWTRSFTSAAVTANHAWMVWDIGCRVNAAQQATPQMPTATAISDDGRTYLIKLREGLRVARRRTRARASTVQASWPAGGVQYVRSDGGEIGG